MRFFFKGKDGGPESSVTGYWLIEWKRGFSVALLHFKGESREAYHTHAFKAISWVLKGQLREFFLNGSKRRHKAGLKPIITRREDYHKVSSSPPSAWAITFRGPWAEKWQEYLPNDGKFVNLTH